MKGIYLYGDTMRKSSSDSISEYVLSPRIELLKNTSCTVEGIKGICEYKNDFIKIDLGKINVTFFGDGLCIRAFSPEGAYIEGTIVSVEFESNG